MGETIGQRMSRLLDDHFIGREFERRYFEQTLRRLAEREERILNVYGPAGIGKTLLLHRLAKQAEEAGAFVAYANVSETYGRQDAVGARILNAFGITSEEEGMTKLAADQTCVSVINDSARERNVVLLLDGYEEIGSADAWLREKVIPGLSTSVLLVIAGRTPLGGAWRLSPAWKRLIVSLPLRELAYETVAGYLNERGITDDRRIDELWLRTLGHPLSLSLLLTTWESEAGRLPAGAVEGEGAAVRPAWEPPEESVRGWLGEAPDEELREWLYVACVPRSFHRELLAEIAGKPIADSEFEKLIGLSFVNRSAGGWQLTELVWETLRASLRARMPSRFAEYAGRAVAHYARSIEEGTRRQRDRSFEIAQLMRFSSRPVLRAHLRHSRESGLYLEPVGSSGRREAEEYLARRLGSARAMRIRCSDYESGAVYRFEMTAEESLLRLSGLPLDELLETGEDTVKLLRTGEGKPVGLFAIVPIHVGTYSFLRRAELSGAYFRRIEKLGIPFPSGIAGRPGGWFVYAMDVDDLEDESLRSAIVRALFEKIVSGGLILQSPPPLDYYRYACEGLGFEPTGIGSRSAYGERYPAEVYEVDTRSGRLIGYLRKMVPELEQREAPPAGEAVAVADLSIRAVPPELTPKEREVAALLANGLSNAEISASLFVSEAAVKKHINAMLSKYGFKNRTQLAKAVLEGRSPDRA